MDAVVERGCIHKVNCAAREGALGYSVSRKLLLLTYGLISHLLDH